MHVRKRSAAVLAGLGLVASGLVLTGAAAAPVSPAAAVPTCQTSVVAVRADGRMVLRDVTNRRIVAEKATPAPLPFKVDAFTFLSSDKVEDGSVQHYTTYSYGARPNYLDVTRLTAQPTLTTKVTGRIANTFKARLIADSGRWYVYGLDAHGRLARWTRTLINNRVYLQNPVVLVARPGALKTLAWGGYSSPGGKYQDQLFATTKSGALKGFRVPWSKPRQVQTQSLRSKGFASYTGVSMSFCGPRTGFISFVYVDRAGNKARWFTLGNRDLKYTSRELVDRGAVAPGANWRLHAIY